MRFWLEQREASGFPVFVAESNGTIAGYASYGAFRSGEGYSGTVEHTVYVAEPFQRRGIARDLVNALIARAQNAGVRRMIGGISSGAEGSYALHKALGFEEVGRLPGIGRKFGQDLDLILMIYRLDRG